MNSSNKLLEISSKYRRDLAEKFKLCAIAIASERLPHMISGQ